MKFATASTERDQETNQDRQLIWVYPDGAKLLNRAAVMLEQNPGDADDTEALKKIKEFRNIALELHNKLWPS